MELILPEPRGIAGNWTPSPTLQKSGPHQTQSQERRAVYETFCGFSLCSALCGDTEIRTPGLRTASALLYRLSYIPKPFTSLFDRIMIGAKSLISVWPSLLF